MVPVQNAHVQLPALVGEGDVVTLSLACLNVDMCNTRLACYYLLGLDSSY